MLLKQLLYRCDIQLLPIIAQHWLRLEKTPNYEELIRMLCEKMLNRPILQKKLLSQDAADMLPALKRLTTLDGVEPAASFEAAAGEFRVAGIEKINREKLWKNPISVTEKLWYNGLIFRENRSIAGELKTCYILPEDLREILSILIPEEIPPVSQKNGLTVRPAVPSETVSVSPSDKTLPDLFCLSAALRRDGRPLLIPGADLSETHLGFIDTLLEESGFFSGDTEENSNSIRSFMVQNRITAVIQLISLWRRSALYSELASDPEVRIITEPQFDKTIPRKRILQFLGDLSPDIWWSLSGFTAAVKKADPGFLRNSFGGSMRQILDKDGNDLSGIGSWYQLEGSYMRFLLCGPLNWLGLVRIAYADKEKKEPAAFRIDQEALFLLNESANAEIAESIRSKPNLEQGIPTISGDGAVTCGSNVPRFFRYMAARCCEIEKFSGNTTIFRITPGSLAEAEKKGISRKAFLALLQRFSKNKVPPALVRMLSAEETVTLPATIYTATILTIPDRSVLEELLETSRLEKWILQQVNPTSLLIDKKGIPEIRRFLMEREVFVDIQA